MKAADAKAPKFDSKWWKANKAKAADGNSAFENALKKYEAEKKKVVGGDGSALAGLNKALVDLKAQAVKTKADPKLGALQKETKEGLDNYAKRCDAALGVVKGLASMAKLIDAPLEALIKNQEPNFQKFCASEHASENYNFLSLMAKNPKGARFVYNDFVKENSKFEINLPASLRTQFDKIAAESDNPAGWSKAPWGLAAKQVVGMIGPAGTLLRFRQKLQAQLKKADLP